MITNIENRNINVILLNARITKKTFTKWRYVKSLSNKLFNIFSICLAQNNETINYLKYLSFVLIEKSFMLAIFVCLVEKRLSL